MSQSRFSIVLVGVSALLRRPLVSRLRPADGERSPWVVFAARGCRFDSGFRSASWPSGSLLPLFGMHRFGVAVRRAGSSAFRFGDCPRRAASSAFRFGDCRSAGWPSGSLLPLFGTHRFGVALGGLVLPPSASEIAARRVGLRAHASGLPSASWPSGSRLPLFGTHRFGVAARWVGLRVHDFRFSARTASEIALGGLAFGLTTSAFRHAPLRSCPRRVGSSAFRFGDCRSAGWASGSRFGVALGELAFGLTASAFRHAPLRSCRWASSFFRLPFRSCRSAGWPSGSLLPLFGMHHFGVAAGRVGFYAFRFGNCPRRVGLRAHRFRFSARTASGLPSAG